MNSETSSLDLKPGRPGALLEGGPVDLPADLREQPVDGPDYKIKLPYNGGYEHFERTDEDADGLDGRPRRIYRWVGRTRVAE